MNLHQKIRIDRIDPNPNQPRKNFTGLEELSASIKEKGLLEPITIRTEGERYQIVIGERRWRAAKLAGLTEIEAQVKDVSDHEAYEMALAENVQRQNLTPMEEAEAFKHLQEQGFTQEQIAKIIGKGQSYIAHKLRLLKMPDFLTFYLQEGSLTENHIRQVAKLKDIYPPGLMRTFSPGFSSDLLNGEEDEEEAASYFFTQLRPEGRLFMKKAGPAQVEACRLFADYVSKHNAKIPQWEVAAFWWASMAVLIPLSVANLTTAINNWQERYFDAVVVWQTKYDREPGKTTPMVPKDNAEAEEYWGFWEDLKHSGSLNIDYTDLDSKEAEEVEWWANILNRITAKGSYCLPSMMQKE